VHAPQVHHDVIVAKFDRAPRTRWRPRSWPGTGRRCGPPGSTPRPARPGRSVDLAVDVNQIHFFAPQTGQAIARQPAGDGSAAA
jgi:hypothetical protein